VIEPFYHQDSFRVLVAGISRLTGWSEYGASPLQIDRRFRLIENRQIWHLCAYQLETTMHLERFSQEFQRNGG
jgi:hypothetical protein